MMVTMTSALMLFTGFVKMYWITKTVIVTVSISVTAGDRNHCQNRHAEQVSKAGTAPVWGQSRPHATAVSKATTSTQVENQL